MAINFYDTAKRDIGDFASRDAVKAEASYRRYSVASRLRRCEMTYREIGTILDLSVERVRQILLTGSKSRPSDHLPWSEIKGLVPKYARRMRTLQYLAEVAEILAAAPPC